MQRMKNPSHPGSVLRTLWLEPLEMTISEAASRVGMSRSHFSAFVNGRARLTPELAICLETVFGSNADTWCAIQAAYDLAQVRNQPVQRNLTPRSS